MNDRADPKGYIDLVRNIHNKYMIIEGWYFDGEGSYDVGCNAGECISLKKINRPDVDEFMGTENTCAGFKALIKLTKKFEGDFEAYIYRNGERVTGLINNAGDMLLDSGIPFEFFSDLNAGKEIELCNLKEIDGYIDEHLKCTDSIFNGWVMDEKDPIDKVFSVTFDDLYLEMELCRYYREDILTAFSTTNKGYLAGILAIGYGLIECSKFLILTESGRAYIIAAAVEENVSLARQLETLDRLKDVSDSNIYNHYLRLSGVFDKKEIIVDFLSDHENSKLIVIDCNLARSEDVVRSIFTNLSLLGSRYNIMLVGLAFYISSDISRVIRRFAGIYDVGISYSYSSILDFFSDEKNRKYVEVYDELLILHYGMSYEGGAVKELENKGGVEYAKLRAYGTEGFLSGGLTVTEDGIEISKCDGFRLIYGMRICGDIVSILFNIEAPTIMAASKKIYLRCIIQDVLVIESYLSFASSTDILKDSIEINSVLGISGE